jgi:cytochrome c5
MTSRIVLAALLLNTAVAAATAGTATTAGSATNGSIDPATGLVIARGWELVSGHCGACHSYRLITTQRGDAQFWRSTIRWMQRTQNLWQIPPEQETVLVSYLAENYNETDWGRRPPLPASQLPPLVP